MKIGILTFHRAINYGAVLQCFALSDLLKKMGHYVEVIDYRPESIERYRMFYSPLAMQGKSLIQKIKYLLVSLFLRRQQLVVNKKFDRFLYKNLNISPKMNITEKIFINRYDIIIFGSDQIWNKIICYGHDKVYWGQFRHSDTKFVTYAASMGATNIYNDADLLTMKHYIKAFDSVSVRETSLQTYIKKMFGVDSTIVSDPTFLIDRSVYVNIAVKPVYDNYVLLFVLEGDYDGALKIANSIANQLNCKVLHISASGSIRPKKDGAIHISNVSPEEFLGYYMYATCCVGISFHATAFSLIFRKDFYCVSSPMQDRSLNLMKAIGVSERLVSTSDDVIFSKINYRDKEQNFETLRCKSIEYLNKVTAECQ